MSNCFKSYALVTVARLSKKNKKKEGGGGKTNKDFPHSQPNTYPKTFMPHKTKSALPSPPFGLPIFAE